MGTLGWWNTMPVFFCARVEATWQSIAWLFAYLVACSSEMTLEDFDDHQLSLVGMSVLSKDHLRVSYTVYVDILSQVHTALRFGNVPVLKFLLQPDANI